MPNDRLVVAWFAVSKLTASVGFISKFYSSISHFKTCVYITGVVLLGWVKSGYVELSRWLQAILFRARGG